MSVRSIHEMVGSVAKDTNAQAPEDEHIHVTPHMLRHTDNTHAYLIKEQYGDAFAQKRLGHQGTTYLAIYTPPPIEEEQKMVDGVELV